MGPEEETALTARASAGDRDAFASVVEPWRRALFAYIYRMVTHPQDAEDLFQDVLLRALESLPSYRGEGRFKSWVFGIATRACLDHLRRKRRWRLEAQLEGEKNASATPEWHDAISAILARPDFRFEIREHIAACFCCVARSLPPEEQAALLLREVFGFKNEEAAAVVGISEPVFRHRLSAARGAMIRGYEGLCTLINKSGVCWQCTGLREFTPEQRRGENLMQIEVAAGRSVSAESLFDARLQIVREADLEGGRTRPLHDNFFVGLTEQEEGS